MKADRKRTADCTAMEWLHQLANGELTGAPTVTNFRRQSVDDDGEQDRETGDDASAENPDERAAGSSSSSYVVCF
jgi:hypothetical protein